MVRIELNQNRKSTILNLLGVYVEVYRSSSGSLIYYVNAKFYNTDIANDSTIWAYESITGPIRDIEQAFNIKESIEVIINEYQENNKVDVLITVEKSDNGYEVKKTITEL